MNMKVVRLCLFLVSNGFNHVSAQVAVRVKWCCLQLLHGVCGMQVGGCQSTVRLCSHRSAMLAVRL